MLRQIGIHAWRGPVGEKDVNHGRDSLYALRLGSGRSRQKYGLKRDSRGFKVGKSRPGKGVNVTLWLRCAGLARKGTKACRKWIRVAAGHTLPDVAGRAFVAMGVLAQRMLDVNVVLGDV